MGCEGGGGGVGEAYSLNLAKVVAEQKMPLYSSSQSSSGGNLSQSSLHSLHWK